MIRIRDVAQRLNLSITTVSRALDGYDDVAEETRQLVVRTAHEMGYTPNRAARQLRRHRAEVIGYILPADKPQFSDAFFSEFIAGLGDEASIHSYDLLVSSAAPDSTEEQAAYQRWVQAGKVDGIILNRIRLHDWRIQYLAGQKMPFACVERSLDAFDFIGVESGSYSGFVE
jgi:LacI family transcriptional regulator